MNKLFKEGIICWIFAIFSFLIFIVPIFILFTCWCFVYVLSKLFRKDLIKPVISHEVAFTIDNFFLKRCESSRITAPNAKCLENIFPESDVTKGTNSIILFLEGKPDLSALKKSILNLSRHTIEDVITNRSFNCDRMFSISAPSFWLGFPYWKKAEKFRMENHIKLKISRFSLSAKSLLMKKYFSEHKGISPIGNSSTNEKNEMMSKSKDYKMNNKNKDVKDEALEVLLSGWLRTPFEQNLWDILIISPTDSTSDLGSEKSIMTVLGFRTHHAIADGLSNLNFLQAFFKPQDSSMNINDDTENKIGLSISPIIRFLGTEEMKENNDFRQIINIKERLVKKKEALYSLLLNIFWTPLVYKRFFQDFIFPCNAFTEKKRIHSTSLAFTQFSLSELKEMKKNGIEYLKKENQNYSHIHLAVIVLSSFSRSLRRFLLETRNENELNELNHMNIVYSLPLKEKHPNHELCNHWTQGIFKLDVKEGDPLKNFVKTAQCFQEVLNVNAPELIHTLSKLNFLLPKFIIKMMINFNMGAPMGLTNLRGPDKDVFFFGCKVASMTTVTGLLWRHAAITLGMISYNGILTISMLANNQVIPNQEHANKILNQYLVEEVLKLKQQLLNNA